MVSPDLIVLIPGILGSELRRRDDAVWGFSGKLVGTSLLTGGRVLRRKLSLIGDTGDPDVDLGDGIVAGGLLPDLHLLPGLWKVDGYSKISRFLSERFALTRDENFFEFSYDWRRDNRIAARQLARQSRDWLASWRLQSPDAQLILVAHSMGGLVSRYFLECLQGWKHTRALITFGTPFRGALNALDTLANGLQMGPIGLDNLTAMARSFTSLYQLLPTYPVYDPIDAETDSGNGDTEPEHPELVRVGETAGIPNVDTARSEAALEFHREIQTAVEANRDDPDWEEQGYTTHPIVGTEQETKQSARRAGRGVELLETYKGREIGGDGTVPRVSAVPLDLKLDAGDMYAATSHGSLQNADAVLAHLAGRIEDFELDFGEFRGVRPSGAKVSLRIEDLVTSAEPIVVRAKASTPGTALTASLWAPAAAAAAARIELEETSGGWSRGEFPPVEPGSYRVRVEGPGVALAVEDALAVADAGVAIE